MFTQANPHIRERLLTVVKLWYVAFALFRGALLALTLTSYLLPFCKLSCVGPNRIKLVSNGFM